LKEVAFFGRLFCFELILFGQHFRLFAANPRPYSSFCYVQQLASRVATAFGKTGCTVLRVFRCNPGCGNRFQEKMLDLQSSILKF
jgi:hypothetical protein